MEIIISERKLKEEQEHALQIRHIKVEKPAKEV